MHSYSQLCSLLHSSPPLLLFTALLLSFLSWLSSAPPCHSSCPLLFATSLHSSHPHLLAVRLLSYLTLFVLSSPSFHSSPCFLIATALLLSLTASSPACFITFLPCRLHVSSVPQYQVLVLLTRRHAPKQQNVVPVRRPDRALPQQLQRERPRSPDPPLLI